MGIRVPKPKKIPRSKLKKECDKLWSLVIRRGGKCEMCGKISVLHAHHLFSRRHHSVRYDIRNGICLCQRCHWLAHHDPEDLRDFIVEERGLEAWEELKIKRFEFAKLDYEVMLKALKAQYEALGGKK